MTFNSFKIVALCCLLIVGCRAKKNTVATSKKKYVPTEKVIVEKKGESLSKEIKPPSKNITYKETVILYIEKYSPIAKEEMLQYGIPASITLAQGILESGAGRGELSAKSNNHFGIKCHKGWTGGRVYHDDDKLQECFRKYKDPKYSFRDHSLFLTQRSRYNDLFKHKKDDYKSWAKGLKKAGYATDPRYPDKLIRIIETYELFVYDEDVLGKKKSKKKEKKSSNIKSYVVEKGDTLYSISRKFNLTVDTLKTYNDLDSNTIDVGQVLYLE
ncbi:glucosaminidase domain-containing protein [Flavobacteriaceae bacterium]|nr:glucosaminidase domain-containing protein [Flavobacteriaceae bacterium]MDC6468260.1 glucosaminidase domain-containing protein [Flavobacteriaceae bacterium]